MLPDRDARAAALTDFRHNLVVTAGAGTGKTSLLVGRVLGALLCQHMDAGRVLAVTFTENAAAEMRVRLQRMLRAVPAFVRGDDIDASDAFVLATLGIGQEHVRRAAEALDELDRLVLATFHGFCLRLLQDHAADLDLPAVLRVGTDEQVRARFDAEFLAFLDAAAAGEHAAALDRFDAAELRELAFALLSLPEEAWDELATPFAPTDLATREADMRRLLLTYSRARPAWRDAAERLAALCADLRAGRPAVADPALDRTPKAGKRELGDDADAAATQALDDHRTYLRGLLRADEAAIALARAFLLPFLGAQRASRARAGLLSFDDLLLLTRRVLMDRGAVRRRLAQRFLTLLVDEFQDTDPLQYDVLFLLASDPERDPGDPLREPWSLPLRPCLFIVGDAKQSVYRFRRADVGAYHRAVEHVTRAPQQTGRALALSANFRSRPPVLQFVNATCAHTLTEDVPYQLGYEPVHAQRSSARGAGVDLLLLEKGTGQTRAWARRQREGAALVQVLRELQAADIELGDIAILLRAAADTAWLLRPLRQAEIPYVLQGSRRFYSRYEIVLAGALLAAMARPFDPVPALAVLRSTLCGVPDADLLRWRNAGGTFDHRVPVEGEGPVPSGLRLLRDLHVRVSGRPLHEALPAILRHEELLLAEGAGFEGAQRLANLDRLLQQLLRAAPVDLAEAATLVERRALHETDDEESPLFEDGADAVRIMTVHAAKGLEFGVVIVPDLARRPPSDPDGERAPAQRLFTGDGRPLVAVRLGERENRAAQVAKQEAVRHQEAEERRLFYVAATRAKERLVLLGHDDDDLVQSSLWQKDLASVPLAEAGVEVRTLAATESPSRARSTGDGTDATPTVQALARHRAVAVRAAQRARATATLHPSASASSGPWTFASPLARSTARARGIAAHAYLGLVDFARTSVDEALLARIAHDDDARDELRGWLTRFHAGAWCNRLRTAQRVEREIPLTWVDSDDGIVHGIVDVLFLDAEGWHVLDWKTDRDPDPARHTEQLAAYARGVQRALSLAAPPNAHAVFLAAP